MVLCIYNRQYLTNYFPLHYHGIYLWIDLLNKSIIASYHDNHQCHHLYYHDSITFTYVNLKDLLWLSWMLWTNEVHMVMFSNTLMWSHCSYQLMLKTLATLEAQRMKVLQVWPSCTELSGYIKIQIKFYIIHIIIDYSTMYKLNFGMLKHLLVLIMFIFSKLGALMNYPFQLVVHIISTTDL